MPRKCSLFNGGLSLTSLAVLILPPPYCQRLGRQLQALVPSCEVLLLHTEEIAEAEREGFEFLPVSFRASKLLKKVEEIETTGILAWLDSIS